jgi:hypothetical protein
VSYKAKVTIEPGDNGAWKGIYEDEFGEEVAEGWKLDNVIDWAVNLLRIFERRNGG